LASMGSQSEDRAKAFREKKVVFGGRGGIGKRGKEKKKGEIPWGLPNASREKKVCELRPVNGKRDGGLGGREKKTKRVGRGNQANKTKKKQGGDAGSGCCGAGVIRVEKDLFIDRGVGGVDGEGTTAPLNCQKKKTGGRGETVGGPSQKDNK